MAECRIRTSVQADLEKLWTKRMEKEDKIMLNKYETLNSTAERLGSEIICLRRGRKMSSAESTVAASSESGGSAGNVAASVLSGALTPTRVELRRMGRLAEHSWNRDHDG